MIDAVSTLSVQSSALRYTPQSVSDSGTAVGATSSAHFVTSRIRVDNLQNVAILEYVSNDGQVVQQYPSQAQIRAFKRAEQLQAQQQAHQAAPTHAAPAPIAQASGVSVGDTAPAPQTAAPAPAPAPTTPSTGSVPTASFDLSAASVASSGGATLTAGSSQSILV